MEGFFLFLSLVALTYCGMGFAVSAYLIYYNLGELKLNQPYFSLFLLLQANFILILRDFCGINNYGQFRNQA